MRTAQDTERQLKAEMQMRLSHETSEKAELLGEIKRQQEAMNEMGSKHKALVDDVMAREDEVVKLEVGDFLRLIRIVFGQATVIRWRLTDSRT